MGRVWQRLGVAVFSVGLLVCFTECKGLKPQPGGACAQNNKYMCTDPSTALLCQNGKYVTMPCRGPKGCRGTAAAAFCDDDLAMENDVCQQTLNENWSCSTDHVKELLCKDGKFVVARTCKGPKKCTVDGSMIHCDDSVADVGDQCVAEPGDANYGCSTDKKQEIECMAATSKFQVYNGCRGQKGCWIENDTVHCDQGAGRAGEACHPVDNHTCSEDATAELKCSPQFTWTQQRACKHSGCKVKFNEVFCD